MATKKTFAVGVKLVGKDAASGPLGKAMGRIRRTTRAATGPVRALGGALTSMRTIVGGLVAGAVVGKLTRELTDFTKAADDLAKTSRAIGLNAEALQEWRHAANISGVDAATLDKAFRYLARGIGDAAAGTGTLKSFLDKASPALLEQIKGAQGLDEAMQLAVKAMEAVEDPARRMALASALFGARSGAALVRMSETGVEGIAKLREEARRYGLITQETAEQSEAFVDAQARLKLALGGVKAAIASDLLPVLTPLLTDLTEWIRSNRELIAGKVKAGFEAIAEAFRNIKQTVSDLKGALETIGPVVLALAGAKYIGGLVASFGAAGTAANKVGLAVASWATAYHFASKAFQEYLDLMDAEERNRSLDRSQAAGIARVAKGRGETEDQALRRVVSVKERRLGRKLTEDEVIELMGGSALSAVDALGADLAPGLDPRRQRARRVLGMEAPGPGPRGSRPAESAFLRQLDDLRAPFTAGEVDVTIHVEGNTQGITVSKPRTTGAARATMPTVRRAVGATP